MYIKIFLLLFLMIIPATTFAVATHVEICNQQHEKIYSAVAYTDINRHLVVEGWWNIGPSSCANIIINTNAPSLYFHAHKSGRRSDWVADYSFCTKNEAFKMRDRTYCKDSSKFTKKHVPGTRFKIIY